MKKFLLFALIIGAFINSIYARENSIWNGIATILFFVICIFSSIMYNNGEKSLEIKKIILFSAISSFLSIILVIVLYTKNSNQLTIALDLFYGLRLTLVFIIIINYYKFYSNPSPKKQFWILIIISIIAISILVLLLISLNKDEFTFIINKKYEFNFLINKKEIKDIALFICISCLSEASLVFLE